MMMQRSGCVSERAMPCPLVDAGGISDDVLMRASHPCRASAGLKGKVKDLDHGDTEEGNQLLGKGHGIRKTDRLAVFAAVRSLLLSQSSPEGWQSSDVSKECKNMREHKTADIPGVGSVASTTYGRARTRVSFYVLHWCGAVERVARIERFVLVSKAGLEPMRLAVGLRYGQRASMLDGRVLVASATAPDDRMAAFPLDDITALLVSAQPCEPADSASSRKRYYYPKQTGKIFFARHHHMSRMVDRQPC